ncbi:MAG TPA: hypothetical protein VK639_04480 [Terriglobales bacterium]|nr:hypothetical protein [Terriglobales bacterium]
MAGREKNAKATEKAAWMLIISALLVIEILAIHKDRRENQEAQAKLRWQEAASFSEIGKGIQQSIQESQRHFEATATRFEAQATTLAALQRKAELLSRQVSETAVSNMSPKELAGHTRDVLMQMDAFFGRYMVEDNDLGNRYFERTHPGWSAVTPKERQQLEMEEMNQRADLKRVYESEIKKTIVTANRLRAEMVTRLVPAERSQDDTIKAAWFEKPVSDRTQSLLNRLNEYTVYLEDLTQRMLRSTGQSN